MTAKFTEWDVNKNQKAGEVSVDPKDVKNVRPRKLRQPNGSHAPGTAIDLHDGRSIRVVETPEKVKAALKGNDAQPGPPSPPRSTGRDVA